MATATPLHQIPIPPGFTAEEADFYRSGHRDGELGRDPRDMSGYTAALRLAYFQGGMDGASVAARARAEAQKPKIHTKIGHERSLCGLAAKNGQYAIASNRDFILAPADQQCSVCARRLSARGYNMKKLRERFLAEDEAARQGSLIPAV